MVWPPTSSVPPALAVRLRAASSGSAVSVTTSQVRPYARGGRVKVTCSPSGLNSTRKESSTIGSPSASRSGMPCPLRNTVIVMPLCAVQSSAVIGSPSRRSQAMSLTFVPATGSPRKNRRRRKIGWSARSLVSWAVNSDSTSWLRASSQSIQLSSLSWPYTLLLPCWVRPSSSPCDTIGTPWLSSSVARKLRFCRSRSALISPLSVGPSTPWFHDRLWLSPSRLPSPLASLCLSLYDTRSVRVNPSCAVTKLIDAMGRRPSISYRSDEPAKREANSPRVAGSPRQKSRTVSRNLPFHSVHSGG